MEENDKPDGSTAMERLARELMDVTTKSTSASRYWFWEYSDDMKELGDGGFCGAARADIERRIEEADLEDDRARDVALGDWKEKVAELDALKAAWRVMPEGMSWPRYADGEPVRVGDVLRTRGMMHGEYRVVGVSACGMASVVAEDVEDDDNIALLDPELMDRAPKAVGADGREVKVGETVWLAHEYREKAGDYSVKEDGGRLMPECDLRGVYPDGAAKVESVVDHCVRLDTSWDAWYPASWLTHERPDTRSLVIDGMDEETVERIDRLVKDGRWLDD